MVNKKWAVKRLTVNLTSTERQKLEQYCAKTGRPFNDVIRELLRSLKVDSDEASKISPDSEVSELARLQNKSINEAIDITGLFTYTKHSNDA